MVELVDDRPHRSASESSAVKPVRFRLWTDAKTCSKRCGRASPTHSSPNDGIAQRVAERREALLEDLLAVSHEQQPGARRASREAARSRPPPSRSCRCRWRPRAGCGGGPARARELELLEQRSWNGRRSISIGLSSRLLARRRAPCARGTPPGRRGRSRRSPSSSRRRRPSSRARRGCARPDSAHVPFEPGDLRAVRQVRRADVRRRVAGQPRGTATPSRAAASGRVVRDPDLGTRVRSASSARFSVLFVYVVVSTRQLFPSSQSRRIALEQRGRPAPADERHHDVDRVGRRDLGRELVPHRGLAGSVREHRRVEQRCERRLE